MNSPPIPLEPGEIVVMAGGRSWHFWLYTLALMLAFCMLLPVLPFLLSGRYWLTQRRFIVASPLGAPKAIALKDITGVDLVATRATLTVNSAQQSVTLRFAEDFNRLWGALALLTELPVPPSVGPAQVQFLANPATAKFPGGWQQGFAVKFDERFVFLPNERPRRTAAEAGKLAGQLALALVGVHVHRSQAHLPFDLWLSLWRHLTPGEFAALLQQTAEARGGHVLRIGELEVVSPNQVRAGELSFNARQPLLG